MAAIDVQAIAEGIATNLRTVTGDITVVPYLTDTMPADTDWMAAEVAHVTGENVTNMERHGAYETWNLYFLVTLYIAMADAEAAQKRMNDFKGIGNANSVWNALETDITIDGLLQKLIVQRSHSFAEIQRGSQRMLMNAWDVLAVASV